MNAGSSAAAEAAQGYELSDVTLSVRNYCSLAEPLETSVRGITAVLTITIRLFQSCNVVHQAEP